jgi:RNA polymerase sigma-70 factor (ECF subfamily)
MLRSPLENAATMVAEANDETRVPLILQYAPSVYRIAMSVTGSPRDAEQVVEETCLAALSEPQEMPDDLGLYRWLVREALDRSLTKLRQREGEHDISFDQPAEREQAPVFPKEFVHWDNHAKQRYSRQELEKLLGRELANLGLADRVVFVLCDLERQSVKETALLMGLSGEAVKFHLLRARLGLRESLSKHFAQAPNAIPEGPGE